MHTAFIIVKWFGVIDEKLAKNSVKITMFVFGSK